MRNAALACFLILIPCSLRAQGKQGDRIGRRYMVFVLVKRLS